MFRLMVFGLFISVVWGGAHLYVVRRMLSIASWEGRRRKIVLRSIMFGLAPLVPLGFFGSRFFGSTWAPSLSLFSFLYMGGFLLLFTFSLLRDAGLGTWLLLRRVRKLRGAEDGPPLDPKRRMLLASAANLGILGLSGGLQAVGYVEATRLAELVEVEVPIKGLPDALDGFKIVQISDVHVGPTIRKAYLDAVVEKINEQSPDLVAITGDLVDGYVSELGPEIAGLGKIKARHGAFFVTGNHEYYWKAEEWEAEVQRLGVNVLHNAHKVLDHEGATLTIAGVTDYSAERFGAASNPEMAFQGAPKESFKLLLAHQPKSVTAAAQTPVDLMLSGHTHGGQFFPITLLVGLAHPFTAGLHAFKHFQIYVSRGTGYWGPPMRLGAPSEITVLTLKKT